MPASLTRAIRKGGNFFIVGHVRPDADTMGSGMALASLIKRVSPRSKTIVANESAVPEQLKCLPRWEKVLAPAKPQDARGMDYAVYLECSGPTRAGNIADPKNFKATINIDHHKSGVPFATINWIDAGASSNAEQIYFLYRAMGVALERDEASLLYAGMVSDTGRFQYSLTSSVTHLVAAELLACGIPFTQINEALFNLKSAGHLKILSLALKSLAFHKNNQVALMRLTREDFSGVQNPDGQTDGIVNYGLAVASVRVAIFIKESPALEPGVISVSLRSRGSVDVSRLAGIFGGGGHANASGCEISGKSVDQVEKLLLSEVERIL